MLRFRFETDGFEGFDRTFNRIEEEIDDFRSIWPSVIREFYQITREQFGSEGAQGASGKWVALKPAYARYKAKKYPGQPILQATGHMFESLSDPEAGDAILKPEKDQLTIGTKTPYAVYHQRGTPKMKARQIISMSDESKRRVQKAIQRPLVAFIRRQGFTVIGELAA